MKAEGKDTGHVLLVKMVHRYSEGMISVFVKSEES